jgi:hypothetical protein
MTMAGRFMASNSKVARPMGVRACNFPESENAKWSAQRSLRGLNRRTSSLVSGSTAWVRAAFLSEHVTHANARFSGVVHHPEIVGERDQCERLLPGLPVEAGNIHTDIPLDQ